MPDLVMPMNADVRTAVACDSTDLEQDWNVTLGGEHGIQETHHP